MTRSWVAGSEFRIESSDERGLQLCCKETGATLQFKDGEVLTYCGCTLIHGDFVRLFKIVPEDGDTYFTARVLQLDYKLTLVKPVKAR